MFKNIANDVTNFVSDHKNDIINGVIFVAGIAGVILFYSASFDYGYECRKNLEKAAGKGIFEAIEALD